MDELISLCQRGNALAWESLIRQQQSRVYAVAFYFLKNAADAQDATQEVFVKIYKNLKQYRAEQAEFVPWMLAITRNCCLDRLRKMQVRNRHESELTHMAEQLHNDEKSLESGIIEEQDRDLLYQALGQLSDESREIIVLKDIQGQKNEDLAQILCLPVGTIKSRASRARIKLAKVLSKLKVMQAKQSESM